MADLSAVTPGTIQLREGISLRGRALSLYDENPFILKGRDGKERPTTKLWISDIPLSCDGADIESAIVKLGCVLCSSLIFEKIRNKDARLARFLTGRRFSYTEVPASPLERSVKVGGFTARLCHKEQPKKERKPAKCTKCLQPGHWVSDCHNDITCLVCYKSGHKRGDAACIAFPEQPESGWDLPSGGDTAISDSDIFLDSWERTAQPPPPPPRPRLMTLQHARMQTRMRMSGRPPTLRFPWPTPRHRSQQRKAPLHNLHLRLRQTVQASRGNTAPFRKRNSFSRKRQTVTKSKQRAKQTRLDFKARARSQTPKRPR